MYEEDDTGLDTVETLNIKRLGVDVVLARKTPTEMGLTISLEAAWTVEA